MAKRSSVPRRVAGRPAGEDAPTDAVRLALVWQLAGDVVIAIATTVKWGVSYHDTWWISPSLDLDSLTVVDVSAAGSPRYVSRAAVPAPSLEPDTTYTFSYAIVMQAGESTWAASGSVALSVGADGALTPVDGTSSTGS